MSETPRIAVIGTPGKWSTEALADAIGARTGFRQVIDMSRVTLDLTTLQLRHDALDLCQLDGLIIKKISPQFSPASLDHVEMLRIAEQAGVRIFSPCERMLRLLDRLTCTITLRQHRLPMPATLITQSLPQARAALEQWGSAILKPLFSTKARGMTLLHREMSDADLHQALQHHQQRNPLLYLQQKVELPGEDLGLVFLGGEYLGTFARIAADKAWNTTIHSGGRYAARTPDAETIALAQRAQALFGLDFATVDIAFTETGPVIFEVSALGGFKGAHTGIGIDLAGRYADYALTCLQRTQ